MPEGRLITASCTTGWLDWVHGELWLLSDGLLRLRTSLAETAAHGGGPTLNESQPIVQEFSASDVSELVSHHRSNIWMPAADIERVDLRTGLASSRANISLRGDRRVKLLWLRSDRADAPLREALRTWGVPVSGR